MMGDPHPPAGCDCCPPSGDTTGLVDRHLSVLFAYAYRLTGSVDEAEELTQQTFLIAHEKIGQLREPPRVQAWLLKVLRNCYLRNHRKRRPMLASEAEIDVNLLMDDFSADSEWDTERLQQALDELPDEFRTVVLMFFFEQLSYRQIADQLDLPMGTVMSRLSRAKHHLRGKLLRRQPQTT